MGGRAFEQLAEKGAFALVLDLSLQEVANEVGHSPVTAGAGRLTGAAKSNTPQIIAPGAADMIDFPAWQAVPAALADRAVHVHNRLIASATSPIPLRQAVAKQIVASVNAIASPCHMIVPLGGVEAWDRPGEPLHDPAGLAAFNETLIAGLQHCLQMQFSYQSLPAHINDSAFTDAVLARVDAWLADGTVSQ
jgi:uncharacterized protein (UPF0261 family)